MGRILASTSNATFTIFLSFLLSYAMLIGLALLSPPTIAWLLDGAEMLEDALTHTALADDYNNWLRIFIGEEQILVLFFTVIARFIIALLGSSFNAAIGRNS